MVIDFFTNIFFAPIEWFISNLPFIDIDIPEGVFNILSATMGYIAYLTPIDQILIILGVDVSLNGFRLLMALIVRLKSFFPTMGS